MRKSLLILTMIAGCNLLSGVPAFGQVQATIEKIRADAAALKTWPVLKRYDQNHLARIALPLGGIGTGTVSLGGRGDLRDWEIMNRAAKGFVPLAGRSSGPFFALFVRTADGQTATRAIEGPIELSGYEESHGSTVPNHGLPRFRKCSFAAAYPFGQVMLSDADVPVDVRIEAFNPLVPGDAEASGIPAAVLRYVLINKTDTPVSASVCANMPNFIGVDGSGTTKDWKGDLVAVGGKANRNEFRVGRNARGIYMYSEGVAQRAEQWGTIALTTTVEAGLSHRTGWIRQGWGSSVLDFWDDFSDDGNLQQRNAAGEDMPMASLAVSVDLPPNETRAVTFLLTWHFPNRQSWTPKGNEQDRIGNYYTTKYSDAWDVAEKLVPQLADLEEKTIRFVQTLCRSDLPEVVKEAARGRPVQRQHAAHPDLLSYRGRTFLRLGRVQQQKGLLPGLVYPCLELRAGDGLSLWKLGQVDARGRVRPR
ncbi:MAG: GH116 family glycosyl-hydrolase, partial [Planctomycetota bacterium]